MAKVRIQIPGDEQWYEFDRTMLEDLPFDELDALEREMDMSFVQFIEVEMRAYTARAVRASAWLARRFAGVTDEPWETFKPNTLKVKLEPVDDVDPPVKAGRSKTSSKAAASETSTP